MLCPIPGLIDEDLVENPAFGSRGLTTSSSRQRSGNAEAMSRPPLLCRAGLHMQTRSSYSATQGSRSIVEKPPRLLFERWFSAYSAVWSIVFFGVTPIAFWIRENSRIHEHIFPFETPPLLFSSFQASLLLSNTAIQTFSLRRRLRSASFLKAAQLLVPHGLRGLYNNFIGEVPQKTCGPGQDLRYLEGNTAPASCANHEVAWC